MSLSSCQFPSILLHLSIVQANSNKASVIGKIRCALRVVLCCVGTAIVTEQHAAMWTDGRYFLQAIQQMDNNWTLMKMGNVVLGFSVVHDKNNSCLCKVYVM